MFKKSKQFIKGVLLLGICAGIGLTGHICTKAETRTVEINTSNYRGGKEIQKALDQNKSNTGDLLVIKLAPGTYKMTESLCIYDNTEIDASGAVIHYVRSDYADKGYRAPLIYNYCEGKKGYTGAGNITIKGGTWDLQGSSGQVNYKYSMEAFRFMHGKNIKLQDMTMQNIYLSHYVTIEGVDQVDISGCTFKDMVDVNAKKEAIHIDIIHNDSMAPSNQSDTIYDDTTCNHVTVNGCTFQNVARGVGTHIAVAGLYPSDMAFTNNYFENVTYEAIKAYHYKNVTVTGNTIKKAGCAIKVYTYADPADSDDDANDDEGSENYVQPLKSTVTESVPSAMNVVIKENRIQDITSDKNGFAIQVNGGSDRVMKGIVIENNTAEKGANPVSTKMSGIYMNYVDDATVNSNCINNPGASGISCNIGNNITYTNNTVTQAAKNALVVMNGKDSLIQNNHVSGSKEHGIYAAKMKSVTMEGNALDKDTAGAIYVSDGCSNAKIKNNTVADTKKIGINVTGSDKVQVASNKITSVGTLGIYIMKAKNALVQSNEINGTGKQGIYLRSSANSDVSSNRISNDKAGAICVDKSATKAVIKKNICKNSGKNAVIILNSKLVTVSANKISKPKNFGIFASNANNAVLSANTISNPKSTAIVCEKSIGSKVKSNTVVSAGKYGILFNKAVKCTASSNKIKDVKNYSLIYSFNSKNRKTNLWFQNVEAKKGKKKITGKLAPKVKVSATVNGMKLKTVNTKKKAAFTIKTAKLKKGAKIVLTAKDSYGNTAVKNITIK